MYTPKHNREEDRDKILAFMRAYSFATLVTAHNAYPRATHLPFVIEGDGETLRLIAHMAKANEQWRDFSDGERVLVVFQEPHAYITPRHYEQPLSVPTWNYVAVHAYGRIRVREAGGEKLATVRQLIAHTDGDYLSQFEALPAEFVEAKLKGIVAFGIDVDDLQARFKLSQDRTPEERQTIIAALRDDEDNARAAIGQMMTEQIRQSQSR